MASAWKNVVPRREHRERPQPEARQHLGLLEKHKDYVKRARAHHSKRDRIVALKRRAELRNKDEFYHGMSSAKTKDGVHVRERPSQQPPVSVLKLLKTQDVAYVGLKAQAERNKIERLRATLHRTAGGGKGKHMLFVDDPRAAAAAAASLDELDHADRSDDEGEDAEYDVADGTAAGSLSAALAAAVEAGEAESDAGSGTQAAAAEGRARAQKRRRETDAGDSEGESGDEDEDEDEVDGAGPAPAAAAAAAADGHLTAVDAADALAAAVAAANASAHDGLRQVSAKRLATEQGAVPAAQLLAAAAAEGHRKRSRRALRRAAKRAAKGSAQAYAELREREARVAVLGTAAAHFEYQKHLMSKGRRVKVADATPNRPALFKWKRERKH